MDRILNADTKLKKEYNDSSRHRKYACLYQKVYEKVSTVKANIDKIFTNTMI